ncbi:fructose 1,6-bisphosphatase [Methanocalculus chunghsingensis]|uniref:fructose 1,6-bisphosphatase n=1 Tax=Methanocalculus chunghsingensis TaxID=156457 RepID=UPI001B8BAE83|nr:fructose 1,6-bisphosphatase [Methanocalculus chunghsingensis]
MADPLSCTLISARLGGFAGVHRAHPGMLEIATRLLRKEEGGVIIDSFVFRCGDAVAFLLIHRDSMDHLQDLVANVITSCREYLDRKGISSGISDPLFASARLTFSERDRETILVFLSDLPSIDLYNLHLFRIFGDPFGTTRLVTEDALREGFVFHLSGDGVASLPEDTYRLLSLIRKPRDARVLRISRRDGEPAASVTTPQEAGSAGLIVRSGGIFPDPGEIIEPFSVPCMVRSPGRTMMPLLPVSLCDAQGSRSGGPPRIVSLGFSIADGRLVGPADFFDDPALDQVRRLGADITGYARSHGPFDPFL